MEEGYIKLFRKFKKWEWYNDINTKTLFLHLLLSANHKDTKWRGKEIKKGQLITSLEHLSKEIGLTVQQTRTSISKLKSTGEITSKATNKYTLLTLINWEKYQVIEEKITSKITSKATNEQQTNNKQITTNNNEKNEKNDNNIYDYLQSTFGRTLNPIEFETIESWLDIYTEEEIKKAIDIAYINNARTLNYIKTVLFSKKPQTVPSWFNKDIKSEKMTKQEEQEIEDLLKEFKE